MKQVLLSTLLLISALQCLGQHTFSIVAVDTVTGEVGSAGATCLSSSDCGGCGGAIIISGIAPGRGAINAQATVCLPNSNMNYGLNQLFQGMSADDALAAVLIADPCNQGDTSNRQYGIVDLDSNLQARSASFTGSDALTYANHRTGITYSIQGNILLGPEVLDSLENAFNRVQGPLCEKLMAAMLAARIPGADTRCLSNGTSSKSSFIRIAKPTDLMSSLWMDLNVPQVPAGMEPIDSLKTLFDAFKLLNGKQDAAPAAMVVYPSPHHGSVQVLLPYPALSDGSITVMDIEGRVLLRQPVAPGQRRVGLVLPAAAAKGLHLVRYVDATQQWTLRILGQ